MLFVICRG